MSPLRHALLGAAVACAPDAALALFGWRREWLPEGHPLVRAHRFMHSPAGLVAACYASHLIADHFSAHRTEETR